MIRALFLLLLLFIPVGVLGTETIAGEVSSLWPVYDYRASEAAEYKSLHLLGPLIKYETKGSETEYAVRPFFYRATDDQGESQTDVLYPLFAHEKEKGSSSFHLLHLLNYDFGDRESGSQNRGYLFPFLFYGEEEQGKYSAFFPFWGTMYNWFGKDRISFRLFPLYSRTEKQETRIDNILWPFFAKISGEDESGYKFWPVYGQSSKQGVYRKKFFLWPIFFSESTGLDTDNPQEMRAAWPFFVGKESVQKSYWSVLWPFFSKTVNREKGYEVLHAPWPLVRITRGEDYHGLKILPFYADETLDVKRQKWYLWPLYKIEEMNSELVDRRRDRVLFFLYSDTREIKWETGDSSRRIHLWPLFGYQKENSVSHFYLLSLLEPFFPENRTLERLWAPLWRVYQQKWDEQGNHVASLMWNLYWHEKQGKSLAWELFPLLEYRNVDGQEKGFKFLKGLLSYRQSNEGKQLKLLYLPWGFHWGKPAKD